MNEQQVISRRTFLTLGATIAAGAALQPEVAMAESPVANRIHIMPSDFNQNCILLESRDEYGQPVFAMVDCADDSYYVGNLPPDDDFPEDPERYPWRDLITTDPHKGREQELISYLQSVGVTPGNFHIFIGTHSHSDHIGAAPWIMRYFAPELVMLPLYSDDLIYNESRLWDNQWQYDRCVYFAEKYGGRVLPRWSDDPALHHPCLSEDERYFTVGQMECEIINYRDIDLDNPMANCFSDANDYSWGVLVRVAGRRIFFAGDICNRSTNSQETPYSGGEARIMEERGAEMENLDAMVLGHHGFVGSGSQSFLRKLNPAIAIYTMRAGSLNSETSDALLGTCTRVYSTEKGIESAEGWLVVDITEDNVRVNIAETGLFVNSNRGPVHYVMNDRRRPATTPYTGWLRQNNSSSWYRFNNSAYALYSKWAKIDGAWYYFDANARMCSNCWKSSGGKWYWLKSNGAMADAEWAEINGKRYWLRPGGVMACNGWEKIDGVWFFFAANGAAATGWLKRGTTWYWLGSDGAMRASEWVLYNNKWYWLGANGKMATGWTKIDGQWYWLGTNGARVSSQWLKYRNNWYWLGSDGVMVSGCELEIGGKMYRFDGSGRWVR